MILSTVDYTVIAAALLTPIVAEVTDFDWNPLFNMGGVALVLVWFLWKAEPRMRAIEAAIDRNSRAILILLLEIQRTTPEAKAQATVVTKEIDAAESARGGI